MDNKYIRQCSYVVFVATIHLFMKSFQMHLQTDGVIGRSAGMCSCRVSAALFRRLQTGADWWVGSWLEGLEPGCQTNELLLWGRACLLPPLIGRGDTLITWLAGSFLLAYFMPCTQAHTSVYVHTLLPCASFWDLRFAFTNSCISLLWNVAAHQF